MELYTVIVQLLNFIILVFLLNKILYKPLIKIIENRREKIKSELEMTENNLKNSENLKLEYENKNKNFEEEKKKLKRKAIIEIEKFKNLELKKAEEDIETEKQKFNSYLESEKNDLIENFNSNFIDLFVEYSNTLFKNLANSTLQNQIIQVFLDKVDAITTEKIEEINKNLQSSPIFIYSINVIDDENKERIKNLLTKKGFNFNDIQYSINTNLILGIELKAGSNIISWNIKELNEDFISKISKSNES